jgi:hypothetical protein
MDDSFLKEGFRKASTEDAHRPLEGLASGARGVIITEREHHAALGSVR